AVACIVLVWPPDLDDTFDGDCFVFLSFGFDFVPTETILFLGFFNTSLSNSFLYISLPFSKTNSYVFLTLPFLPFLITFVLPFSFLDFFFSLISYLVFFFFLLLFFVLFVSSI